ncbi:MAG: outer membrane beta-barrel protein [Bacteroidota bacterium]|nr:outer membrane beta-barrel protein [Bacteroidota bacterium]
MRTFRLFLIITLFLPAQLLAADSPRGGGDDILRPVPFRLHVGPYAGGAWIAGAGNFETVCDCEYSGGNGLGFDVGMFADYPLSSDFSLMATFGLRSVSPVYEKSQTRIEYIEIPPDQGAFTEIGFDLETSLQLTLVHIALLARWDLQVAGLYIAAGPELGIAVSDNIEEVERITTPGIGYDTYGGSEQVVMDGDLSRYYDDTGYQLALSLRLGYIFALHERLALAPELSFSLGQTPIASEYQSWKLNAYRAQVYLRFAI